MHPLRTRAPTHGEHDTHARMGWTHTTPLKSGPKRRPALSQGRRHREVGEVQGGLSPALPVHGQDDLQLRLVGPVCTGRRVPHGGEGVGAPAPRRLWLPVPLPTQAPSHPISISISLFYPAGSEGEGERQEYQVLRLVTGLPPGSCVRAPSTSRLPGTEGGKRRKRQLV